MPSRCRAASPCRGRGHRPVRGQPTGPIQPTGPTRPTGPIRPAGPFWPAGPIRPGWSRWRAGRVPAARRAAYPGLYIRVSAYDASLGRQTTALSFIVNRPAAEPGFRLDRQEASDRRVRYSLHPYATDQPAGERYGSVSAAPGNVMPNGVRGGS